MRLTIYPTLRTWTTLFTVIALLGACTGKRSGQSQDRTLHLMKAPARVHSGEPFLTVGQTGKVYLSWMEDSTGIAKLKFSQLNGDEWSGPVTIAAGINWFVNWADYPVMADNGESLLAHFLERSAAGKYTYDVKVTSSGDGGLHWSTPVKLNEDEKQAEHGFVSMIPYKDGFFVTWLDGRNTVMEGMEDHQGHHGAMTLRAAILDKFGKKVNEWELDERTCDCCQTSAAITDKGPVVVYRDRSNEEIRDISIVRFENGAWTLPTSVYPDHWKISGCPVNGPRVVADGSSVAVGWFTAANDSTQVKVVFSNDGGRTFGQPVLVNERPTIGRIDLEMVAPKTVVISWMEDEKIKLKEVHADGTSRESFVIASLSSARSNGFPQMVKHGDNLIIAWTDDSIKSIKVGKLPQRFLH